VNEFTVVIPARYASSRLPGKVLADIGGRPMIQWVHERAVASGADNVIVATDDARIADACRRFGARVEMTAAEHVSGTDRIAELAGRLAWDDTQIVVNVQGDEPLLPPSLVAQAAGLLAAHPDAGIATLAVPLRDEEEFSSEHTAKVVVDRAGFALYFSREPVPWAAGRAPPACARRHIGLYAYRVGDLKKICAAPPCDLEQAERLEQLRALWLGVRIVVADAEQRPGRAVDTEADLAWVRAHVAAGFGNASQ
jgi:3-deoxy-manno-octulosonate cytidylyltransferase (CMP-KDO synthetase)